MCNSPQLEQLISEGRAFMDQLREIAKEVDIEIWWPRIEVLTLADVLERGWKILDKSDPGESIRFKQALEREREEKVIDSIKDWATRAADCVNSFAGTEASNKIINSIPSIEAGFSRAQTRPAPNSEEQYWTLSQAVNSRVDALLQIHGR